MKCLSLLPISLGGFLCLSSVQAQTSSSTPPIGFIRKDCPANSDTRVSIPLERQSVFIGPITKPTGSLITTQGNPAWEANEFKFDAATQKDTYYVLFLSGAKRGRDFTVTANTANTLTVDLKGDTLSDVNEGDRIKLLPHWNLDTAFPAGDGIAVSPNFLDLKTQILMPETQASGINFAASELFYYDSSWKRIGGNSDGSRVLAPHRYMVVRNKEQATSPVFVGVVPSDFQAVPLRVPAGANAKQDNLVSLNRPLPVKLRDSDLISSGAFKESTSPLIPTDVLLVFNDTEAAINKSSSATYFYFNGQWAKVGPNFTADAGDEVIFTPGTGVIIRKSGVAGSSSEQTLFWTHDDPTN